MKTQLESFEANNRLTALMMEAGSILREHPDLGIGRIAVNEHGVQTYFAGAIDESRIVRTGPDALRDALNMVKDFPPVEDIEGAGFAAIFEALSASIDTIDNMLEQPRCCHGNSMTAAGKYLEQIQMFMRFERNRIMVAAEAVKDTDRDDGNHCRLDAILRFKVQDADLTYEQAVSMIEIFSKIEGRSC